MKKITSMSHSLTENQHLATAIRLLLCQQQYFLLPDGLSPKTFGPLLLFQKQKVAEFI